MADDGWIMDDGWMADDGWMMDGCEGTRAGLAVTDMPGALLGSGSRQLVRDGAGSGSVCAWVSAVQRFQPCRLQSLTPNVPAAPLGAALPAGQQLSKQNRADGMVLPGQGASRAVT